MLERRSLWFCWIVCAVTWENRSESDLAVLLLHWPTQEHDHETPALKHTHSSWLSSPRQWSFFMSRSSTLNTFTFLLASCLHTTPQHQPFTAPRAWIFKRHTYYRNDDTAASVDPDNKSWKNRIKDLLFTPDYMIVVVVNRCGVLQM